MAAVTAADLIIYLSANAPEDDVSTSGGAINAKVRLMTAAVFDSINGGTGDRLDLVSSSGSDTCNVSVYGYGTSGQWFMETVALSGTNHVQSVNTYKHVVKVVMASDAVGTVTIARYNAAAPVTLTTIVIGERGYQRLWIGANAAAVGGAVTVYYCKAFVKNTNTDGTHAVIHGGVWLALDGSAQVKIALEMSASAVVTNGSETTTNRLTKPTTGGTYTFVDAATAGAMLAIGTGGNGNLATTEAQGIWLELTLAAGATPSQVATLTLETDVASS